MFVRRFQDRRTVNRMCVWSSTPYLHVSVRPAGAQVCQGWWRAGRRSWEAVAPAAGLGRGRAAACGMGFCFCSAFAFLVKLWGVQPKSSRGAVAGQAGGPSRAVSRPEDGQEGAAQGRMRTKWFLFSFHTLRLHRCIGHPSTEALPGICLLVC